jgi:hypothetical protein
MPLLDILVVYLPTPTDIEHTKEDGRRGNNATDSGRGKE